MISNFFIGRPIFAAVLSIVVTLAGVVAVLRLPIAQYPDVTPPTVIVTASYPGANCQTVQDTIAAPVEADRRQSRATAHQQHDEHAGNCQLRQPPG